MTPAQALRFGLVPHRRSQTFFSTVRASRPSRLPASNATYKFKMASTAAVDPNVIEAAKRKAAYAAVAAHFNSEMAYVGIGSGSTIVYGVEAIREHLAANPPKANPAGPQFVPTGAGSRRVIEAAGLKVVDFAALPVGARLEVAFDGADEVDAALNCIKGGGACLFQEKLVAMRARRFIALADYRKQQPRLLGASWPTIPIEVAPIAAAPVLAALTALGSPAPFVRQVAATTGHTGPLLTDQGFYIVDAPFAPLLTREDVAAGKDGSGKNGVWEVDNLARAIKAIPGVLEVGLFWGQNGDEAEAAGLAEGGQKPVAVYFGMGDGGVSVQEAQK